MASNLNTFHFSPNLNFSAQLSNLVKDYWKQILLAVSCCTILAVFIITRLPFFLYYPLPFLHPDSQSYLHTYIAIIDQNTWPNFAVRTPVYPLFIFVILYLTNKIIAFILMQTVLIFLSALFLVYTIHRFR